MDTIFNSVPLLIIAGSVGIPVLVFVLLGVGERVVSLLPVSFQRGARPWVWLFGPIVAVSTILIYPLIDTIVISFKDAESISYVGFANYVASFTGTMTDVLFNNLLWLTVFPAATMVLALVAAVLFDKIRYERIAMTVVILPTAISFTAGSVIWTQMYSFQPEGKSQLGTFNALWTLLPGAKPVPWLINGTVNNFALILIAVWLGLGTAVLVLSAAVKNVAREQIEAARIDGASEWRIFRSVTLPSILPAVLVVLTTQVIAGLKVFDIVYVMTNGNFNTDVIANRMFNELFAYGDYGRASAIAVILLLGALPIVFINIFQFRREAE